MPFTRFSPVVIAYVDHKVTGVERGCEPPQYLLLPRALWALEQDDRTAAVSNLRQLKLAEMVLKGCKCRAHRKIPAVAHVTVVNGINAAHNGRRGGP